MKLETIIKTIPRVKTIIVFALGLAIIFSVLAGGFVFIKGPRTPEIKKIEPSSVIFTGDKITLKGRNFYSVIYKITSAKLSFNDQEISVDPKQIKSARIKDVIAPNLNLKLGDKLNIVFKAEVEKRWSKNKKYSLTSNSFQAQWGSKEQANNLGDLNQDGFFDEKDLAVLVSILNQEKTSTDLEKKLGDLNNNQKLDYSDYLILSALIDQEISLSHLPLLLGDVDKNKKIDKKDIQKLADLIENPDELDPISFYQADLNFDEDITQEDIDLLEQMIQTKKPADVTLSSTENHSSQANAGTDKTIKPGETIILDGSGSYDPDQDPLTYKWEITSGGGSLTDADKVQARYTAPSTEGSAVIKLTVSDGKLESSDEVKIEVKKIKEGGPTPGVQYPMFLDPMFLEYLQAINTPDNPFFPTEQIFMKGKFAMSKNPRYPLSLPLTIKELTFFIEASPFWDEYYKYAFTDLTLSCNGVIKKADDIITPSSSTSVFHPAKFVYDNNELIINNIDDEIICELKGKITPDWSYLDMWWGDTLKNDPEQVPLYQPWQNGQVRDACYNGFLKEIIIENSEGMEMKYNEGDECPPGGGGGICGGGGDAIITIVNQQLNYPIRYTPNINNDAIRKRDLIPDYYESYGLVKDLMKIGLQDGYLIKGEYHSNTPAWSNVSGWKDPENSPYRHYIYYGTDVTQSKFSSTRCAGYPVLELKGGMEYLPWGVGNGHPEALSRDDCDSSISATAYIVRLPLTTADSTVHGRDPTSKAKDLKRKEEIDALAGFLQDKDLKNWPTQDTEIDPDLDDKYYRTTWCAYDWMMDFLPGAPFYSGRPAYTTLVGHGMSNAYRYYYDPVDLLKREGLYEKAINTEFEYTTDYYKQEKAVVSFKSLGCENLIKEGEGGLIWATSVVGYGGNPGNSVIFENIEEDKETLCASLLACGVDYYHAGKEVDCCKSRVCYEATMEIFDPPVHVPSILWRYGRWIPD